jgi:hypothetical protein
MLASDDLGAQYVSTRPFGAPRRYGEPPKGTSCRLTVLGQHYWGLVEKGLI